MSLVVDSFSRVYTYRALHIRRGFGTQGVQLEKFLEIFRIANDLHDVQFADPGLDWQSNQYDGRVCIGVFEVVTIDPTQTTHCRVGIIGVRVHDLERKALEWFQKNRQRNSEPGGHWPKPVELDVACSIYPVKIPDEGML